MNFEMLGYPDAGPTLDLDHTAFAYAGKFVTPRTGKAVARDDGTTVGATAFNEDYSDEDTYRIRYVTVREERRGEGVGPRLLRYTAAAVTDETTAVRIAVNNPIAYQACYRAGFVSTGEETGIAELLLRYAPETDRSTDRYQAGLSVFQRRDLPQRQLSVLRRHVDDSPPPVVPVPG